MSANCCGVEDITVLDSFVSEAKEWRWNTITIAEGLFMSVSVGGKRNNQCQKNTCSILRNGCVLQGMRALKCRTIHKLCFPFDHNRTNQQLKHVRHYRHYQLNWHSQQWNFTQLWIICWVPSLIDPTYYDQTVKRVCVFLFCFRWE